MQVSFFLKEQEEKRQKIKLIQTETTDINIQLDRVGHTLQKYIDKTFESFVSEYKKNAFLNVNEYSAWNLVKPELEKEPIISQSDLLYIIFENWSNSIGKVMELKHTKNNSNEVVFTLIMTFLKSNWKEIKENEKNKYLDSPKELETFISDLDEWTNKFVWKISEILPMSKEDLIELEKNYESLKLENEEILKENLQILKSKEEKAKREIISGKKEDGIIQAFKDFKKGEQSKTEIKSDELEESFTDIILYEGVEFDDSIKSGNYFFNMKTQEVFKRVANYWQKLDDVLDSLLDNFFIENGVEYTKILMYPDEILLKIVNLENLKNET